MTDPRDPEPTGRVPDDVLCTGCGYPLRALDSGGQCPECGVPIARSLAGDRLDAADPAWVGRVARGQALLAWGLLVVLGALLATVLSPAPMFVALLFDADDAVQRVVGVVWAALAVATLLGLLVTPVGAWLVTSRDPRSTDVEPILSSRRIARFGLIGVAPCAAVVGAVDLQPGAGTDLLLQVATTIVATALATVTMVAMLRWLAQLARRVPDPELESRTRGAASFVRWALPLAAGCALVLLVPAPALPRGLEVALSMLRVASCCTVALGVPVMLVAFIGNGALMLELRRVLRASARAARGEAAPDEG